MEEESRRVRKSAESEMEGGRKGRKRRDEVWVGRKGGEGEKEERGNERQSRSR